MSPCYARALWVAPLLVCGFLRPAQAESIVVPLGGQSVAITGHRTVCKEGSELNGWSIEAEGSRIRPPSTLEARPAVLRVTSGATLCVNANDVVRAVAVDKWPSIDAASLVLNVDAGRLDLKGHGLRGVSLRWQSGAKGGGDVCRDPQAGEGGYEICAFTVDRDLSADASATEFDFVPAGAEGEVALFDVQGRPMPRDFLHFTAARVVLLSLFAPDVALDAEADVARLPLRHVEAVGSVDCTDATCDLEGTDIVVRGEHGSDETLDLRLRLRPHVYLQGATGLDNTPTLQVALQRCPVSIASSPPLRGVTGQNVVVRLGGRCQKDASLRFFVQGSPARLLQTLTEGDSLFAVLHVDRIGNDEVVMVSVQHGGGVVGIARGRTRAVPAIHARLELPGLGAIDFIPTNRDAYAVLPTLTDGGIVAPLPVDGVYTVTRDPSGVDLVRATDSATGWVALRLAYRDKTLPPALRDVNLAEIPDAVDRAIKSASIPVTLTAQDDTLVELICNDESSASSSQKPGMVNAVPYTARDSCRLVLHRERLKPEDGEQTLRLTASVSAVDGYPRPEAQLDQVVRLKPGMAPRMVYLGGVVAPFDRMVVRVAVQSDDTHYAVITDEKLGAPPLQWSVIMGTSKLRLYATTSFPTGLFRVADEGHSGILGLNGGVLFRFVWLTEEGHQSPIGVETGVMWMGIAGDTTASSHGQVAAVAGLGISVPIANVSRLTQASISLHAWAEYEVSRAVLRQSGNAWGFVFGPSLSVGDVGVNF